MIVKFVARNDREERCFARLRDLVRLMNVYGAISRETKKYVQRMRKVEPWLEDGKNVFEGILLYSVSLKMDFPKETTLEGLYGKASERKKLHSQYTPPEIKSLDGYFDSLFGQKFGEGLEESI